MPVLRSGASTTQEPTPHLEAFRNRGRPATAAAGETAGQAVAAPAGGPDLPDAKARPGGGTYLLTLEHVVTTAAQATDADALVTDTLMAMVELPGVDAVAYHEIDRASGLAHLKDDWRMPQDTRESITTLDIACAPYHNALVQRQPVFIRDVAGLSEIEDMPVGFDALAMLPVVASDDVVGALSALARRPREWSHEDQLVLPAIGREVGAALGRLAANEALRDRRLPMHDLFNTVGELLAIAAADGRMLWVNEALERRLGLAGASLSRMTMLDLFPPGHRIQAAATLAELLERDGGVSRLPLLAHDGTHIDVETHVRWGTWDGRRVLYIVSREAPAAPPVRDDALFDSTLEMITGIAYMHDPATAEHARRVTKLAASLADKLGLPPERVAGLKLAAGLHDVGKTAIPADVLLRPGRLSGPELALVRAHPAAGCEMVREADSPWPLADIILQHHERLDGSGYPRGLHGGEILAEARILAVADVFEAMSSSRPYRDAYSLNEALQELRAGSGRRYDPDVVAACVQMTESGALPVH